MNTTKVFLCMSGELSTGTRNEIVFYANQLATVCGFNGNTFNFTGGVASIGGAHNSYQNLGITFAANGSSAIKAGGNGSINLPNFQQQFTQSPVNALNNPLFTIVSHNSAHHMTYVLANKAFAGINGDKLLITFDNHTDQHTEFSNNTIKCGNFIRPMVTNGIVQRVLHYGWQHPNFFNTGTVNSAAQTTGGTGVNTGHNWNQILTTAITGGGNITGAYITVDRDFMEGSCTPYGDGRKNIATARGAVQEALTVLKAHNIPLVGFDITGLPIVNGVSAKLNSLNDPPTQNGTALDPAVNISLMNLGRLAVNPTKATKIAFADVKCYYDLVNAY